MSTHFVDFNRPAMVGNELTYIQDAVSKQKALCGNGLYGKKCSSFLEQSYGIKRVLLTTSCTSALEMAALLLDISPGDEVIMPSFTFVSTANAFVLRGAKPVFVDIRQDTLNIDENSVEQALSPKTKAIVPVHYAGVGAEMDSIEACARSKNIVVIEDAAQGVDASYRGKPLGSIAHLGTYSFHETKNCTAGEGGALLINDERYIERAEIIHEKGTNRKKYHLGLVDKYSWVDIGSSFVLSELNAAYLFAQLEKKEMIKTRRKAIWNRYYSSLKHLELNERVRLPVIPEYCDHNGHLFYLLCRSTAERSRLLNYCLENHVHAAFHFVPLHQCSMAKNLSCSRPLPVTEDIAGRLVRLPIFFDLTAGEQDTVIESVCNFFASN